MNRTNHEGAECVVIIVDQLHNRIIIVYNLLLFYWLLFAHRLTHVQSVCLSVRSSVRPSDRPAVYLLLFVNTALSLNVIARIFRCP